MSAKHDAARHVGARFQGIGIGLRALFERLTEDDAAPPPAAAAPPARTRAWQAEPPPALPPEPCTLVGGEWHCCLRAGHVGRCILEPA